MSGVVLLYTTGSWPLALIVLIASVMIPLGKIAGARVRAGDRAAPVGGDNPAAHAAVPDGRVHRPLVDARRVRRHVRRRAGPGVAAHDVDPGPGVVYFMAVVVLTMFAAQSFDPRLIWDAAATREDPDAAADRRRSAAAGDGRPAETGALFRRVDHSGRGGAVAIGIAAQRDPERGPDDHRSSSNRRRDRGRQDLRQIQGRQHRPGDRGAPYRRLRQGGSDGEDRQVRRGPDGRGRDVLGGASADQPERHLRAVGTLLSGDYIGFQAGASTKTQAQLHRYGSAADHHRRRGRHPVHAEAATWARSASARPSTSPVAGGTGRRVRPLGRRQGRRRPDLRQRPYDRYVGAARASGTRAASTSRSTANGLDVRTQSLVALLEGGVAFDTPPVRRPVGPAAVDAVFTLYGDRVTAMKQDEAFATAIRSLLRRVVARPIRRRAGPVLRCTGRRGHRRSGLMFDPRRRSACARAWTSSSIRSA